MRETGGHAVQAEFGRAFRAALAAAIQGTGIQGQWLEHEGLTPLPWLCRPGEAGGYRVLCGLRQYPGVPACAWPAFLQAVYRSDDAHPAEGARPLDVVLAGPGARDPRILAAMTVAAILGHEQALALGRPGFTSGAADRRDERLPGTSGPEQAG
jgi:hypothetical protein